MNDLEQRIQENPLIQRVGIIEDPFHRDVTTKYIITLLDFIRIANGQDAVDELISILLDKHLHFVSDRDQFLKHISNEHNWIDGILDTLIFEYGREYLQIEDLYRFIGRTAVNPRFDIMAAGESFGILFIYREVARLNPNFNTVIDLEYDSDKSTDKYVVIRMRTKKHYKRKLMEVYGEEHYLEVMRSIDLLTQGVLEGVPKAVNFQNDFAEVVSEPYCESRGDDFCEYHLVWRSETDFNISQVSLRHPRSILDAGFNLARGVWGGLITNVVYRIPQVRVLADRVIGMEVEMQRYAEERLHAEQDRHTLEMQLEESAALARTQLERAELVMDVLHNTRGGISVVNRVMSIVEKGLYTLEEIYRSAKSSSDIYKIFPESSIDKLGFLIASINGLFPHAKDAISDINERFRAIREVYDPRRYLKGDIAGDIGNIVKLQESEFKQKGISIETYLDISSKPANYSVYIVDVIRNLLTNAVEAVQLLGQDDKRIRIRADEVADRIRVSVYDNGVGVSPENTSRLFVKGFRTKPKGQGRGLYFCQQHLGEIGGRIFYSPCDIEGYRTKFTFELPIAKK